MPNNNYNVNGRYNTGNHVAGGGRVSNQATLQAASTPGLSADGTMGNSILSVGRNAAGVSRNNGGGNVAGAPRSVNNT